jgi:TrkA domain protein
MSEVSETKLPGIGVRYDFTTSSGSNIGVLVHRTGRRDLLVYSAQDPESCLFSLELDPSDARTLTELFGASKIAEELTAMQQDLAGLAIDWIRIDPDSEWAGKTMKEAAVHTTTGVSVVAVITGGDATAAPGADDVLAPGGVAVAVGTPEGLEAFTARVRKG